MKSLEEAIRSEDAARVAPVAKKAAAVDDNPDDNEELKAALRKAAQSYGNVSTATVGTIQRQLRVLENQGATKFCGEPALTQRVLKERSCARSAGPHACCAACCARARSTAAGVSGGRRPSGGSTMSDVRLSKMRSDNQL